MTDQEKLTKLIDAVFEWASRPTKDGAKNLRDLADSLDPRHMSGYAFGGSVEIVKSGVLTPEIIQEAADKIMKKSGGLK